MQRSITTSRIGEQTETKNRHSDFHLILKHLETPTIVLIRLNFSMGFSKKFDIGSETMVTGAGTHMRQTCYIFTFFTSIVNITNTL